MRNIGIFGSFLGQRIWSVVVLFTKYIIIDPKLSWPHTEVILPFPYKECTTDSIWKSPVFSSVFIWAEDLYSKEHWNMNLDLTEIQWQPSIS